MLRPLALTVLAAMLIGAACQSEPDLSGRPTEADEAVINVSRFKTGDGSETRLATLPVGTIYGDGRVIRPGPQLGIGVPAHLGFPDHCAYGPADVARIRRAGAGVVTTEKDLVKLARVPGLATTPLHAIRLAVEVKDGDRLVDLLLAPSEVALRPD